ncbi:MAG: sigma-70 family RNA polymerase sigma factor [Deltaproteobacteria bacterium]|nr:sigma-70 family RNA polymerase sigma factor [Deltaproteobacteria bacterium]
MSGVGKLSEERAISAATAADLSWSVTKIGVVPSYASNAIPIRRDFVAEKKKSAESNRLDESSRTRVKSVPDYQQIFCEYAPYVLRVLPRLGVAKSDLEDVCQEVFLAVYRKLSGFEGRSSFRTWLYGICLRTASNYRQRAYRWREIITDRPPESIQRDGQIERLNQRETRDLLDEALSVLRDYEREVVVLYEIEELDMAEVARAVGCSKFTAYARLYSARKQMRSFIRRRDALRRVP